MTFVNYTFLAFAVAMASILGCGKKNATQNSLQIDMSSVKTERITATSVICSAKVVLNNAQSIKSKGFCVGISSNPSLDSSEIILKCKSNELESKISGLKPDTKYFVRAFVSIDAKTVYSAETSFITAKVIDDSNLLLGNPSFSVTDLLCDSNYLMVKPQYVISYSNRKHTPNWVSWHLSMVDIGDADRNDDFRGDNDIPQGWVKAIPEAYSKTGFDKGHMCPSADRTKTVGDNSATFYMTNMVPQSPKNNRVVWNQLEAYSRKLVSAGNELYIVAGTYGKGGTGGNGYAEYIGNGIEVPSSLWKIIAIIPNGDNDLGRVDGSARVIAVLIPNNQDCSSKPWYSYRVSVDSIERITGYDFFSNISDSIQDKIECVVDTVGITKN
jgi:endonuclease G